MNEYSKQARIHGDVPITDAELRSAIKRINDRLYQLEKNNLQKSEAYYSYKNFANRFGGISYGKRPSIKVGRLSKLSEFDRQFIMKQDLHGGSVGKELKKAEDWLKSNGNENPTRKEKIETANQLGEIHQFIEDNDDIIYAVESMSGTDVVHGNNGKLTQAQIDRLYKVHEEYDELKSRELANEPKKKQDTDTQFDLSWL